jgi:hypothetical protein
MRIGARCKTLTSDFDYPNIYLGGPFHLLGHRHLKLNFNVGHGEEHASVLFRGRSRCRLRQLIPQRLYCVTQRNHAFAPEIGKFLDERKAKVPAPLL